MAPQPVRRANARSSKSRIACVGLLSKRPEYKGHGSNAAHDCVITFIGVPENSTMFALPPIYDEAMSEHFKAVADAGFNVVDPLPFGWGRQAR